MINKQIEKPLEPPHQETIVGFNTLLTKPFDSQKISNMEQQTDEKGRPITYWGGKQNKQQTAVDWLIEKQLDAGIGLSKEWREQAKQMEKEQMKKMYNHAMLSLLDTGHGQGFEEYYNETYGK